MNVASLENCKRLYELSGWGKNDSDKFWIVTANDAMVWDWRGGKEFDDRIPAHDLGYLLRKLPRKIALKHDKRKLLNPENSDYYWLTLQPYPEEGMWVASYDSSQSALGAEYIHFADTPEDALCLLAIKLFEEKLI